jgi:hypothetical protein
VADVWKVREGANTEKKLGDILNEFEIFSTQHWQDGKKIRGYPVAHFASAFAAYLGLEAVDAVEPASTLDEPNFSQSGMESLPTASENCEIGNNNAPATASTALSEGEAELTAVQLGLAEEFL